MYVTALVHYGSRQLNSLCSYTKAQHEHGTVLGTKSPWPQLKQGDEYETLAPSLLSRWQATVKRP